MVAIGAAYTRKALVKVTPRHLHYQEQCSTSYKAELQVPITESCGKTKYSFSHVHAEKQST